MRSSFLWDKGSRHLRDSCSEFRENNILFSEGRTHVTKVRRRHVLEERELGIHHVCVCVCVCVCSLRYPARNARAPYFHLWTVHLYCIFPRYLIKVRFSEKKMLLNVTCVLISSTAFIWSIFHSMKLSEIWSIICVGPYIKCLLVLI